MIKKDTLIIVFISAFLLIGIQYIVKKYYIEPIPPEEQTPEEQIIAREFGIAIDSFLIRRDKIKANQTMAEILSKLHVPYEKINKLTLWNDSSFDIRKIRKGNQYNAYFTLDSSTLCYFVYEHSLVEYLLIDLRDSIHAEFLKKETRKVKKTYADTISGSLWATMTEAKVNPVLAIELSEIYAWVIDFFGLDSKDHFKVIFEEEYVDSISIGVTKIYTSSFTHLGHTYHAIPFIQDGKESYYDEEGQSLKRQFLKAPLRFSRISSRFSGSRLHPVLKIRRPHYGVDYAAPYGTPVYAVGSGTVIEKTYNKGAGNMVKVRHNSVYTTAYLHLSKFGPDIKKGAHVAQGQLLGYVGSTGLSTGPHLDFRFWKNGHPVDPLTVESPPVEPVKEENKHAFDSVKNLFIRQLDSIPYQ